MCLNDPFSTARFRWISSTLHYAGAPYFNGDVDTLLINRLLLLQYSALLGTVLAIVIHLCVIFEVEFVVDLTPRYSSTSFEVIQTSPTVISVWITLQLLNSIISVLRCATSQPASSSWSFESLLKLIFRHSFVSHLRSLDQYRSRNQPYKLLWVASVHNSVQSSELLFIMFHRSYT